MYFKNFKRHLIKRILLFLVAKTNNKRIALAAREEMFSQHAQKTKAMTRTVNRVKKKIKIDSLLSCCQFSNSTQVVRILVC